MTSSSASRRNIRACGGTLRKIFGETGTRGDLDLIDQLLQDLVEQDGLFVRKISGGRRKKIGDAPQYRGPTSDIGARDSPLELIDQ
jgi:hypothetical protein